MAPAPDLNDLIATVDADTDSDDPLARLATASTVAGELAETGDALVGHFVDACRAAGHTWAEISESLGVSRQAAHKRYSSIPRDLERWTPRAKAVLAASVDAARGLGHAYVGTEHLLLGLFPPGASARTILAEPASPRRRSPIRCSPTRRAATPGPPSRRSPRSPRRCSAARSPRRSRWATTTSAPSTCCSALFGQPEGLAAEILADAGADARRGQGQGRRRSSSAS